MFIVAGGAPLHLSTYDAIGGPRPGVHIDGWDIDHTDNPAAHLRPYPGDGTFLSTSAGRVYRVAGGAPFGVSNWSVFGGVQRYVTVDQWDLDHIDNPAAHVKRVPVDGTLVEGLPSNSYWSFSGGLRSSAPAASSAVAVDDAGLATFQQVPASSCPAGQTGTPPNCQAPPSSCPAGQTGTPPNCQAPPSSCPAGQTGTPPKCQRPSSPGGVQPAATSTQPIKVADHKQRAVLADKDRPSHHQDRTGVLTQRPHRVRGRGEDHVRSAAAAFALSSYAARAAQCRGTPRPPGQARQTHD